MKLGIVYNIFDGLELLQYSVKNIYNSSDHIIFIYSDISNNGEYSNKNVINHITEIKNILDVDKKIILQKYNPDINLPSHKNEINKRNLGLNIIKNLGCEYLLFVDCDEIYEPSPFNNVFKKIKERNIYNTIVSTVNYYKHPTIQFEDTTKINFITKISKETNIVYNNYPEFANIDPTRKYFTKGKHIYELKPETLICHHFSYVRKNPDDIIKKLFCSSARGNWPKNQEYFQKIKKQYIDFKEGYDIILPLNDNYKIIKDYKVVENIFNI